MITIIRIDAKSLQLNARDKKERPALLVEPGPRLGDRVEISCQCGERVAVVSQRGPSARLLVADDARVDLSYNGQPV